MPQKKLDLLQFAASTMAESCARSPQIVWGNAFNHAILAASVHDVPNDILADAIAPHFARATDRPEDSAAVYPRRRKPAVHCIFNPLRDRHGPDVSALAHQIDDGPVPLPSLDMLHRKS